MIDEDCHTCKHLLSFRREDKRHPCYRCESYDRFKIRVELKADLQDKVTEIIKAMK